MMRTFVFYLIATFFPPCRRCGGRRKCAPAVRVRL